MDIFCHAYAQKNAKALKFTRLPLRRVFHQHHKGISALLAAQIPNFVSWQQHGRRSVDDFVVAKTSKDFTDRQVSTSPVRTIQVGPRQVHNTLPGCPMGAPDLGPGASGPRVRRKRLSSKQVRSACLSLQ